MADRVDQKIAAHQPGGRRRPGFTWALRRVAAASAVLLAAAGLAVTGVSSGPALAASRTAQPMMPAWRIVKQVHNGPFGGFSAVTAVGKNGGWAFNQGSAPTAWRRSGSTWTQVPFPGQSDERVVAAAATSATNVWAFTDNGTKSRVLRWNGRTWTAQRSFAQQIGGAVVISPRDVWVFGQPFVPGAELGAWHYNGRAWSHTASGHGLEGGSALSANDVWAFDGSDIAHWNGSAWSRASVGRLLPARQQLNDPRITGIFAQSSHSVYAIANGNLQDEGGPMAILHWDGYHWFKVAAGNFGFGTGPLQQISSDGRGGLWIPMPGVGGQKSYLLHYSAGHVTVASLPGGVNRTSVDTVALIPGTCSVLAGGYTHSYANPGTNVSAVLLQYGL